MGEGFDWPFCLVFAFASTATLAGEYLLAFIFLGIAFYRLFTRHTCVFCNNHLSDKSRAYHYDCFDDQNQETSCTKCGRTSVDKQAGVFCPLFVCFRCAPSCASCEKKLRSADHVCYSQLLDQYYHPNCAICICRACKWSIYPSSGYVRVANNTLVHKSCRTHACGVCGRSDKHCKVRHRLETVKEK